MTTTETLNKLTGPKVTQAEIDALVVAEQYHHFPHTRVTVCCLTLRNEFSVIGESSCVADENFNHELGRQIAREDAIEKVWWLEGYLLRQKLTDAKTPGASPPSLPGLASVGARPLGAAEDYAADDDLDL